MMMRAKPWAMLHSAGDGDHFANWSQSEGLVLILVKSYPQDVLIGETSGNSVHEAS